MVKDFRTFTSVIPLKDKTVVLFSEEGFANTVEEKIELASSADESGDDLYVAWPGNYETHVFAATAGQILGALMPKLEFEVGDLVRVTKAYSRARVGLVGVVRLFDDSGELGVEFAGFTGHTLGGTIKNERGYWIPSAYVEAA